MQVSWMPKLRQASPKVYVWVRKPSFFTSQRRQSVFSRCFKHLKIITSLKVFRCWKEPRSWSLVQNLLSSSKNHSQNYRKTTNDTYITLLPSIHLLFLDFSSKTTYVSFEVDLIFTPVYLLQRVSLRNSEHFTENKCGRCATRLWIGAKAIRLQPVVSASKKLRKHTWQKRKSRRFFWLIPIAFKLEYLEICAGCHVRVRVITHRDLIDC